MVMGVHMCDLCFTRLRQYELITQARRHYAWGSGSGLKGERITFSYYLGKILLTELIFIHSTLNNSQT